MAVAWPKAQVRKSTRMEVVVLQDEGHFQDLFGQSVGGFVASKSSAEPIMVLVGRPPEWTRVPVASEAPASILNHEMAHQLSAILRLRQPRWLAEGIACLLETVEISEDGSTATVGAANLSRHAGYMKRHARGAARELFAWSKTKPDDDSDRLYGTAWLLVHWLYNTRADGLSRYQVRLIEGLDPAEAWRLSFPGLSPDELDRLLYSYASFGEYRFFRVPIRLTDSTIHSAPLADAEVHATWAQLGALAMHFQDRSRAQTFARTELEHALRADPNNLTALLAKENQASSPAESIALLRRATDAHPGSGPAWMLLAGVLAETGGADVEVEAAYRNAIAALPESDVALNNLAWLYVGQRRFAEALPLSVRAVALDPGSPPKLGTHAHVLEGLGHCAEALSVQRRAVAALFDVEPAEHRVYRQYLRDLEQRCPEHPPPANGGATGRTKPH
jgi:Tfp pilus assembly protein PilF